MICDVSREYFKIIYKRLNITVEEFGESFYNKMIPGVVKELEEKGLVVEDDTVTKKGVKKEIEKKDVEKKEPKKEAKKEKKEENKEEKEEEENF